MGERPRPHPSSRAAVLALASLLVAGLLSVGPARAHSFTKSDGNDTPGRLDIRSSNVSHTSTSIAFKIRTYETGRRGASRTTLSSSSRSTGTTTVATSGARSSSSGLDSVRC
jgi:hypothetical protein